MDFRFGDDVEAFRREVRDFLAAEMSPERTRGHADPRDLTGLDEEFERRLQRLAGERGHLGPSVPAGHGGSGLPPSYQAVFGYEAAAHDAPLIDTAMTLAGQVLIAYGSPEQRDRLLPPMMRGEIEMAVAYTEREAGSDLAALAAEAVADAGGFVLSGTKVLVTGAHKADWCCTVARTGPPGAPARAAMTMFLVDMRLPGVRVRRRPTMNGWTLDEIEFAAVRLGPGSVVGERDAGWGQLVGAVAAERSGMAHLGFARRALDALIDHVRGAARDGRPLAADPLVRDALAGLEIDAAAGLRLAKRTLWSAERGDPDPALASMSKLYATELLQRIAQAATEIAGHPGTVYAPLFGEPPPYGAAGGRLAWEYLERVHGTIGAGTSELQRDVIARAGLGLTRGRR